MHRALFIVLALAMLAPLPALGQDKPSTPRDNPSTTDAEIAKLVAQLGSDDYQAREEASKRLRQIGKPALPALKAALSSPDAEVVSRARGLIARIEVRPVPGPDPNANPFANVQNNVVRLSVVNGQRMTEVTEGGREVKIVEGPGRITMTVTGWVEGERVTEEFTAGTPDELKAENPDAFRLYEQWTVAGVAGPGVLMRPGIRLQGGGMIIGPAAAPQELDILRVRLEKQMKEQQTTDAARDEISAAIDRVAAARDMGDMEEYLKCSDELHALLEKQKLDPGELLPPPAKTRLGVSIRGETRLGLLVGQVTEKSRAERLGLQAGDVIQKVDGKQVTDVGELRKAVAAREKGLVIEVRRDGEDVKLEEK